MWFCSESPSPESPCCLLLHCHLAHGHHCPLSLRPPLAGQRLESWGTGLSSYDIAITSSFKASKDVVQGWPLSSLLYRCPAHAFIPPNTMNSMLSCETSLLLKANGDKVRANQTFCLVKVPATSTARVGGIAPLPVGIHRTHRQFSLSLLHLSLYPQAKNPTELNSRRNFPHHYPPIRRLKTISLAPGTMHFHCTM